VELANERSLAAKRAGVGEEMKQQLSFACAAGGGAAAIASAENACSRCAPSALEYSVRTSSATIPRCAFARVSNRDRTLEKTRLTSQTRKRGALFAVMSGKQQQREVTVGAAGQYEAVRRQSGETGCSGEFVGHEVSFSVATGAAVSIPERFIPDAFRQWGVPVLGFDRVTSSEIRTRTAVDTPGGDTAVDAAKPPSPHSQSSPSSLELYIKISRILPTVGCEADAVVPEITTVQAPVLLPAADATLLDIVATELASSADAARATGAVVFPGGSFSTGVLRHNKYARLLFALAFEEGGNDQNRLLIEVSSEFRRSGTVSITYEQRDGAFCGGAVLCGCGGRVASFAKEQVDADAVFARDNVWHLDASSKVVVGDEGVLKAKTDAADEEVRERVFPKNVRVRVRESEAYVIIQVAAVRENTMNVIERAYACKDGKLSAVASYKMTRKSV